MKKAFLMFLATSFVLVTAAFAGPPTEVWNVTYESGGNDQPLAIAADAAGNAYVTGYYGDIGTAACRTIKYDTDGNIVWNKLFEDPDIDIGIGWDVDVDASGNVYVAGWAWNGANWDYLVIKYDAGGSSVWAKPWDGLSNDLASGVAVDALGNVYVTGSSDVGGVGFRTIKYDSGGNLQWSHPYDEFGNGSIGYDVAVDAAGNVYVTGLTNNGSDNDYLTIKYDTDGNFQWSDARNENYNDEAYRIAVDADANLYVTGRSWNSGGDYDFFTVKYDTDGNFQWKKRYGASEHEGAYGVAVDEYFVYVTGYRDNGVDVDFLTVRYDKEGTFSWEKDFDSGDDEMARGIAVDGSHYLYVTGFYYDGSDYDFRTIKYEQDDIPAVAEIPTVSSLTLEIVGNLSATPTLNYSLPAGMQGRLTFYSVDGRAVRTFSVNSSHPTLTWDGHDAAGKAVPAGVYFVKLVVDNESVTVKAILAR